MDNDENILKLLESLTLEELSYTIGRYAGVHNALLSEKKYGFSIPKALARKVYDRRELDEAAEKFLLSDDAE